METSSFRRRHVEFESGYWRTWKGDPSNNPGFVFPADWKTVTRKKRQISFAWGPLGGGDMKNVAGIEFAITAGTGGKGTVWIDDLELTPLEPDGPYTLTPAVTATSSATGHEPGKATDGSVATSWRSTSGSVAQSLDIDFLKRREFGGLVVDWENDHRPYSYTVSSSTDGKNWTQLYTAGNNKTLRDYLYLPESDARYLRFSAPRTSRQYIGLSEITVEPLAWSASMNDFYTAIAKDAKSGDYPRYYSGKQNYWTVVGVNGDFFAANPGSPSGILMRGGALDFAPASGRSSLGIAADGTLTVARVGFDGTWRGIEDQPVEGGASPQVPTGPMRLDRTAV